MAKKSKFDMEVNLKANSAAFKKNMNQAKASVKKFSDTGMNAFGMLNSSAGRFVYGFQQGIKTVSGLAKGFKTLKTAIASSGIGLVIIAIGTALAGVSAWLTKTTEGADKLNVAWTKTKAVGGVFFDRMIDGGKGLVKVLMGNKQGIQDIGNSFKGVLSEIRKETQLAADIAQEDNQLKKDKIAFIVQEARLQMQIADLIRESKNLEYDRAKRQTFLTKAIALQNKLSDQKVAITSKELDLQQRRMDMGHNSYEDLEAEANLKKDLLLIEKDRDDKARELENRVREVNGALSEQEKITKKILADQVKIAQVTTNALATSKIAIEDFKSDLGELNKEMERVLSVTPTVDPVATRYLKDQFKDINNVAMLVSSGIWGVSAAFTQLAETGKLSMKIMVTSILTSLEGLIQGYLATMIAGALASESKKGLVGLVTGSIAIAGFMALWRSKVPEFADGAIVRGETIARVGEYNNANIDPEVIAPLSKLKGMLGGRVKGRLVAEGTTLVSVIESVNQQNKIMG